MPKKSPKEAQSQPCILMVSRSAKHLQCQLTSATTGKTLATVTDYGLSGISKSAKAAQVGQKIAQCARQLSLSQITFKRGPYLFHGRVKAMIESARAAGLKV